MPLFQRYAARLLLSASLLLLIAAAGCRDYRRETLEFDTWGFHNERYNMQATDEILVRYPLVSSGQIDISEVRVQTAEPTITSSFTQLDSGGRKYVNLYLRTNRTAGGFYPIRISIVNRNGDFIERAAGIEIVNFAQLLRDTTRSYFAEDTLSEVPFRPERLTAGYKYEIEVRQRPSDPPNRFIFSTLGYIRGGITLDDVVVDVDSVTGEINARVPFGLSGYKGTGRLRKLDGYDRVTGHFIYTFSASGTDFEGHVSF